MEQNKIKIGIIGAGRMGITHYSIINSHSDITITAVADPSGIILSMIDKYLPVKTYKDYNELITRSKPDAILVCTPPNLHYPIIKNAFESNIHVFVEKPFTNHKVGVTCHAEYLRPVEPKTFAPVNSLACVFCKVTDK